MKDKYKKKRTVKKYSRFHHSARNKAPIRKKTVREPSFKKEIKEFFTPPGLEEMRDLSYEEGTWG